jgi:hypothetical protein
MKYEVFPEKSSKREIPREEKWDRRSEFRLVAQQKGVGS